VFSLVILFSLIFAVSCSDGGSKASQQEECAGLFKEILSIQDSRDQLSSQMQVISSARKQRAIGRTKYIIAFDAWLQKEARLREDVTSLYDIAYLKGCFEEGLR